MNCDMRGSGQAGRFKPGSLSALSRQAQLHHALSVPTLHLSKHSAAQQTHLLGSGASFTMLESLDSDWNLSTASQECCKRTRSELLRLPAAQACQPTAHKQAHTSSSKCTWGHRHDGCAVAASQASPEAVHQAQQLLGTGCIRRPQQAAR